MTYPSGVLIGLNAAVETITAAAFDRDGRQVGLAAWPHPVSRAPGGVVEHDPGETWQITVATLRKLAGQVPDLARRTVALAITGQADGTWLVDEDGDPVAPAWSGLDRRARPLVERWRRSSIGPALRQITGVGLHAGRQSAQLAWLVKHRPELVAQAATALHCKDWLYFCCTGERATDAAEAVATFGDVRMRAYDPMVLQLLSLEEVGPLLPEIVDGARHHARLTDAAAAATGLWSGTPVALGPVDTVAAALGAGVYAPEQPVGCSILGPAGVHARLHQTVAALDPPAAPDGETLPFVVPGSWLTCVTPAAAGANVEWLIGLCAQFLAEAGLIGIGRAEVAATLERKAAAARPGSLIFHPIPFAGGPDPHAEPGAGGQMLGLSGATAVGDLMRAIHEGVGFAARAGYAALDLRPVEIRLAGDLAGSAVCRTILAACAGVPVRRVRRDDVGAAGAALIGAVALGQYGSVAEGLADWVDRWIDAPEPVDPDLALRYDRLFEAYRPAGRQGRAIPPARPKAAPAA